MTETKEVDNREEIVKQLQTLERPLTWLANKTGIPYNTLHSCLTRKLFKVSEENLSKINEVLGTSF